MGIKNEGELHARAELEMLRSQNDELRKPWGRPHWTSKSLKKSWHGTHYETSS